MEFRASAFPRIAICNGSYLLERGVVQDRDQTAAAEGTLAHEYASEHLNGRVSLEAIPDHEMRAAVTLYTQVVRQSGEISSLQGAEESHAVVLNGHTLRGTTDYFSWDPFGALTLLDLKYGFGWVEVKDNWQFIAYAVLMWLKYGQGALPKTVRCGVVQPRANHPDGPVRYWEFPGEMLPKYLDAIQIIMVAASLEGADTIAGKHCRYCKAIVDCHTNRESVSSLVDVAQRALKSGLSGVELAYELDIMESASTLIQHRLTALASEAMQRVKDGEIVPGRSIRQEMGALKWSVQDPIAAGQDIEVDLAQEQRPITPTQALSKKLLSNEQIKIMASRSPGAFKLKKDNLKFAKELIANAARN